MKAPIAKEDANHLLHISRRMDTSVHGKEHVMEIRQARPEHLDAIMSIYAHAKVFMAENGNPTQWNDSYPTRELLEKDIEDRQCYVCVCNGQVHGVFILMSGIEPTYALIEDGEWKRNGPYGTIHRLAADGKVKGVGKLCIDFCKGKEKFSHLRADTHQDNKIMQHILEQNGFERCGIVYMPDGSPRIAYST
jgi:ribosomal protein S18 acetylase RimI-like enzyme